MAYGVKPPPLGDLTFNLAESADYIFDHAIFNDCMANVDFCEQMVKETNPTLLAKAENTPVAGTATSTASRRSPTVMRALNPFTGEFYLETLPTSHATRVRCTACSAAGARTPRRSCRAAAARTSPTRRDRLLRAADALLGLRQAQRARCTTTCTTSSSQELPGYDMVGYRADEPGQLGVASTAPTTSSTDYTPHDGVGAQALHHPGGGDRRRADLDGPGRDQPDDPDPASGSSFFDSLGERARRWSPRIRSATRWTRTTRGTR